MGFSYRWLDAEMNTLGVQFHLVFSGKCHGTELALMRLFVCVHGFKMSFEFVFPADLQGA